eukprot:scaffold2635_cov106-Isochrysis_galbana.AAC.4
MQARGGRRGAAHVIHWAEEGQRLRAIRGISDGARVQPVPELVAVAVKGGQHQGSVQNARQSHTGRQALPQPVQMVHVLLASHVQLLCRAVVAPCAGPRGRVGDRLVLFEHQVARVGVALRRLVVHEPHAPVTKALPLAKRVVGLKGGHGKEESLHCPRGVLLRAARGAVPFCVSPVPFCVSPVPFCVSPVPFCVSPVPFCVSPVPFCVSPLWSVVPVYALHVAPSVCDATGRSQG